MDKQRFMDDCLEVHADLVELERRVHDWLCGMVGFQVTVDAAEPVPWERAGMDRQRWLEANRASGVWQGSAKQAPEWHTGPRDWEPVDEPAEAADAVAHDAAAGEPWTAPEDHALADDADGPAEVAAPGLDANGPSWRAGWEKAKAAIDAGLGVDAPHMAHDAAAPEEGPSAHEAGLADAPSWNVGRAGADDTAARAEHEGAREQRPPRPRSRSDGKRSSETKGAKAKASKKRKKGGNPGRESENPWAFVED